MSPEEGEGTDLDGLTMYCGFLGCCRQFFKVQGWKVTISFHQYQFYTPWNLRWPGAKPRHRTVRMLCPSTHGAGQGGLKGELWNWLWSSSCRHPFCSFFSRILKGFSLVWDPSQVVNLVISTLVSNLTLCDSEMDTMHDSFNVQQVQGNEIQSIPSPVRVQWREYQEVMGINKVYPPWNQQSHSPWK